MIPSDFLANTWVQDSFSKAAFVVVVTLAFTLLAKALRGVTVSGGIAGSIVCFLLIATIGPAALAVLVSVFALTSVTTRFRFSKKARLGTAERKEGRSASQVAANLGVAAACAIAAIMVDRSIFLIAFASAMSEAAADTVSTEVGQAYSDSARLITTGASVPAGTNGGVTLAGTFAGAAAAGAVSGVSLLTGLIQSSALGITAFAGTAGMFADSFLGAWFEQRGKLNNNGVNFLSTLFAAALGAACWLLTGER